MTSLLCALAILLVFVFLAARMSDGARDSQSLWQQNRMERKHAFQRVATL